MHAIKCADCGETYMGKTERQYARRMIEHGAPKEIFDQQPKIGHNVDDNNSTTNDEVTRGRKNNEENKQSG